MYKRRFLEDYDPYLHKDGEPRLRLSSVGVPCERKLWYSLHKQGKGEPHSSSTLFKFFFGDLIESVVLGLAKEAGHDVQGEQSELVLNGIKGRRDCVIDGITVDVKSASSNSWKKFKDGITPETDPFGYLTQLGAYVAAAKDDPLVTEKNKGAFLAVDKQHGHIILDVHEFPEEKLEGVKDLLEKRKALVTQKVEPKRGFDPVPDGKSGNMKLGTNCSYCDFRDLCHPNLRTFIYSNGPRYLTNVAKLPNVYEKE